MIYYHTYVNIVCNSGGKIGQCIKVLHSNKCATISQLILIVIKSLKFKQARVKKKKIYLALVLRNNLFIKRFDSTMLRCFDNSVILLNKDEHMLFTSFSGPAFRELRHSQKYLKILLKASYLV